MHRMKNPLIRKTWFCLLAAAGLLLTVFAQTAYAEPDTSALHKKLKSAVGRRIGVKDALIVTQPEQSVLFEKFADRRRIPASVLKILTALFALETLGPNYRFPTDFYIDDAENLGIKGYGDPNLVSEIVEIAARTLAERLPRKTVGDIVLDTGYFKTPLTVPGVGDAFDPYDAKNAALCVNFNTVNFIKTRNGYKSDEPQTPLLPAVLPRIRASGLSRGRICLTQNESVPYAGHLFRHFLELAGVTVTGEIREASITGGWTRIFRFESPLPLTEMMANLMEYSNNFMANQLLVAAGAHVYGAPGTMEKGLKAARRYAARTLGWSDFIIAEGAGISRENRVTARQIETALGAFRPYRYLMRKEGREFYKTGTLSGVRTRAGFIMKGDGEGWYGFVILLNTPGKSTIPIRNKLFDILP